MPRRSALVALQDFHGTMCYGNVKPSQLFGWHDDGVNGVNDIIARYDVPSSDMGAGYAKCVSVFLYRRSLTMHHCWRGQFLNINGRSPGWKNVMLQYGN
jgi:hypothetical protein